MLKVSLAAIPLLLKVQRAIARQVHAAMGATNHRCGVLLAGRLGRRGGRLKFTPQPYRSENQDNPEQ
ncbi:hypothetical protein A8L59_22500 [Pseudomonas koreensis]|uniref:Uncharacterized protein n=1 Tax=Pseudomonas koreensis TaxID=198620 RepID=A0AAC9BWQ9_9PSED|nr:hypothetical protein A8L59_22500 [Pseudomonas koreensis]